MEGSTDKAIALNESPIVASQSKKVSKLGDCFWNLQLLNGLYLSWVSCHTLTINHMSQALYL
jgi:hypothetical protein